MILYYYAFSFCFFFFFFNDTATTEIYTLSLHDALPISAATTRSACARSPDAHTPRWPPRSEEHTSELQSRQYLVCRLLLEKKQQAHRHVALRRCRVGRAGRARIGGRGHLFFFFNDTATTEIYTLSLHDALPI